MGGARRAASVRQPPPPAPAPRAPTAQGLFHAAAHVAGAPHLRRRRGGVRDDAARAPARDGVGRRHRLCARRHGAQRLCRLARLHEHHERRARRAPRRHARKGRARRGAHGARDAAEASAAAARRAHAPARPPPRARRCPRGASWRRSTRWTASSTLPRPSRKTPRRCSSGTFPYARCARLSTRQSKRRRPFFSEAWRPRLNYLYPSTPLYVVMEYIIYPCRHPSSPEDIRRTLRAAQTPCERD